MYLQRLYFGISKNAEGTALLEVSSCYKLGTLEGKIITGLSVNEKGRHANAVVVP